MSCTILKNIPYECVTEIKICRLKKRLNKTQQFTSSFVFKEKQNNQERKKKKNSAWPSCQDLNLGLPWNVKLIWKRVFTPFFEVAFRSVCTAGRSCLFRRMLQGCFSAPGTKSCTTFSIGSGEYWEWIFLPWFICSLKMFKSHYVWLLYVILHLLFTPLPSSS